MANIALIIFKSSCISVYVAMTIITLSLQTLLKYKNLYFLLLEGVNNVILQSLKSLTDISKMYILFWEFLALSSFTHFDKLTFLNTAPTQVLFFWAGVGVMGVIKFPMATVPSTMNGWL